MKSCPAFIADSILSSGAIWRAPDEQIGQRDLDVVSLLQLFNQFVDVPVNATVE